MGRRGIEKGRGSRLSPPAAVRPGSSGTIPGPHRATEAMNIEHVAKLHAIFIWNITSDCSTRSPGPTGVLFVDGVSKC